MMHMVHTTHGHVAQVVACHRQACKGMGCVAVSFTQYIDLHIECEHAPQHGDALSMTEPDTHTPTIKTDMDVPVTEVTKAVEVAPSSVCYCGLLVASYKVHNVPYALEANLSEAVHFELAVSGVLEFKLIDSDQVLGHVEVKPDDIEAEIMVPNEHKAEAYASIKQCISLADENCVTQ